MHNRVNMHLCLTIIKYDESKWGWSEIFPRGQMRFDAQRKWNKEIKGGMRKARNGRGVKHVAERLQCFLIPGLRVHSNYLV